MLLPPHHAGCQSVLSNRIFLNIYLDTFFGVLNFGNKSAMRFFFFWKASKFDVDFKNAKKKTEKRFLVSEIMASEMAAVNCLYYEGNTSHGKSMR